MPSYAAVPVNRDTVFELFSHVADVPDGKSRLAWALFRYPWVEGCEYFFIGGNYLGRNQPDYTKQILRRSQLDSWFTYDAKAADPKRNGPKPNGYWFVVTPRKGVVFRESRNNQEEPASTCNG